MTNLEMALSTATGIRKILDTLPDQPELSNELIQLAMIDPFTRIAANTQIIERIESEHGFSDYTEN